ncbi:MAG: MATE family efflux transporter [Gammaproteobacteria bacterium]|nr:MATE family efflux transporter [Gammaproteobacteria bacterium]
MLRELTVPMVFGIVSLLLFNLADTFFISLLGTRELAALGFTFPVTMFVTYLGIGLGIGTSALVARGIGAGDHDRAARIATDSLLLATLLVVVLAVLGYVSIEPLFLALGATPDLVPLIASFMHVWLLGVVFFVMPMVVGAALRATGDTRTPSLVMLGSAGLNGVLDPLLIFGLGPVPGFGLQGAAIASALAWIGAASISLIMLHRREHLLEWRWPGTAALFQSWRRHLAISGPAAAANMLTPVATGILTATVATYGAEAVAAYGVAGRIEALALIVVLAMSTSLPPFLSQNHGAGRIDRVREAVRIALRFTLAWELGVYLLIVAAAPWIAALFTDAPQVDRVLRTILYILPLSYGFQGIVVLSNSSFNALHAPRHAVVLSVLRWFVLYVPCALAGAAMAGLTGLFAGAMVGNLIAGSLAGVWITRHCRRLETH